MSFKNLCMQYETLKNSANIAELNFLFDNDINVCNYVANQLPYTFNLYKKGEQISQEELINKSLQDFKKFSEDNYCRLADLIINTPIFRNQSYYNSRVSVTYSNGSLFENCIVKDSGRISQYNIPIKLYNIHIYTIGHEHCHALKETNYYEFKDSFTIGETIPIFYELFCLNPNDPNTKKHIQMRLHSLWRNKKIYLKASELCQKNPNRNEVFDFGQQYYNQRSIYEFMQSYIGSYLNSFYYAIILYNLYKQNPNKILTLVSHVLSQYITTYDLLTELDIYGNIQGETFEKELHELKRILKK